MGGVPGVSYTLEFFFTPSTGFGQGRTYIGPRTVSGGKPFTISGNAAGKSGGYITATATDGNNDTSAFSHVAYVTGGILAPLFLPPLSWNGAWSRQPSGGPAPATSTATAHEPLALTTIAN